jgi:hypothetical protein
MTKHLTYHNTKEKKEDGIILILSIGLCSLQAKDFESAILNSIKLLMARLRSSKCLLPFRESYLNLDKSKRHLMLSKRIRDDFDAAIQEDASLNYKLSYEIGNSYQSVPAVLRCFLKPIPNNASKVVENY